MESKVIPFGPRRQDLTSPEAAKPQYFFSFGSLQEVMDDTRAMVNFTSIQNYRTRFNTATERGRTARKEFELALLDNRRIFVDRTQSSEFEKKPIKLALETWAYELGETFEDYNLKRKAKRRLVRLVGKERTGSIIEGINIGRSYRNNSKNNPTKAAT